MCVCDSILQTTANGPSAARLGGTFPSPKPHPPLIRMPGGCWVVRDGRTERALIPGLCRDELPGCASDPYSPFGQTGSCALYIEYLSMLKAMDNNCVFISVLI